MRPSVIPCVLTALFVLTATARAEDCTSLSVQSEQIACLQGEIEQLRREVDRLRAGEATLMQWIDDRIKSALANPEPRIHPLGK